jgi:acetyl esterase
MAPDYPYPQSINDCYAVTIYVLENCNQLGGDLNRLVIAGDSAGGNKKLII